MTLLDVRSVSKTFGEHPILEDVNVTVVAGESVALVGHNGAGKTSLLAMCAGIVEPTSGEILVGEARAGEVEARRLLSYIPDRPVLYDDISVAEHIDYVGRLHGVSAPLDIASPLIERLSIGEHLGALPQTLSLGTRQKLSILLALVRPFELLVADEPLNALDVRAQEVVADLIRTQRDRGAAVFVATHDLEFASTMERVVGLREGTVTYDGPVLDRDLAELVGSE